jgi:hypothetical protein
MNEFRKKGLVRYNGGLQINKALLIAFLEKRPMSVKKTQTRPDGSGFRPRRLPNRATPESNGGRK